MRKLSSLLIVLPILSVVFGVWLMKCHATDYSSNSVSVDLHQQNMEIFLNPELRSEAELFGWAVGYDSSFTAMMVSDSSVTKEDLRLINIIREFIPNLLNYDNFKIEEKLFIAFHRDVSNRPQLISVLQNAYAEMSSIFRQDLNLEAPEGYIFVLIFKDRQQIGDEEIGGFVIRASRFIVIPQAYYFHRGFVLFDSDQFHANFKHELVHAFINASAGYKIAIDFPEWFHEMAAISLGGNRKYEVKGETIHRLSTLYQEYHDAAKHLQQKFGRTKYHIFLRESIRNGDPLQQLTSLFGYESYDALRWDSMSFAEKTSERFGHFIANLKNRIDNADFFTVIFVFFMMALPVFLSYWLVRENVDRMRDLRLSFSNADRFGKNGKLVDSLQCYRLFLAEVHHARGWEQFLIRARNKIHHANAQVNQLQLTIFNSVTGEIQKNRISDILIAEKKCFELENIKNTIFNDDVKTLSSNFLSNNAPTILSEAWGQRNELLENYCKQKQYVEAIENFINYAVQHYKSAFFPQPILLKSLHSIIKSMTGAYQQKSTFIRLCKQIQKIKKISVRLKHKKLLAVYYSNLNDLFLAAKPYCQVRRIMKHVKSQRIESNLIGLTKLLDVLDSKPDDSALQNIVLSVIEKNIIDDLIQFSEQYNAAPMKFGDVSLFDTILTDNFRRLSRIIEQDPAGGHEKIRKRIIAFFQQKK